MSSEWIIGVLAVITIGGTLGLSIFHFGFHLKHPENLAAAKQVAADRESAATAMSSAVVIIVALKGIGTKLNTKFNAVGNALS